MYALLLVEEEDRKLKEVELGGRAERLDLMCRKNAYLQDKVWCNQAKVCIHTSVGETTAFDTPWYIFRALP